jgi:hypothetical protein
MLCGKEQIVCVAEVNDPTAAIQQGVLEAVQRLP